MAMFWIQFVLVLGAVLIGIRRGGVALGLIGGLGVSLLVLGFRSAPSEPPIAVMLIILAVVTASATLQVAGGLDYLVQLTAAGKPVAMTTVVQFVMLAFGSFIMFSSNVKAKDIAHSSVFIAGMIAVVSIFGIAWMSDTFISANKKFLVDNIGIMVKIAPWTFAIATFCISAFVKSQAATLAITLPLGLALGLPVPLLLGLMPASYAYFFFAFYPSDLAAINMDRTGTTRIGKYLLNHSSMVPGFIGVVTSTVVAYAISRMMF